MLSLSLLIELRVNLLNVLVYNTIMLSSANFLSFNKCRRVWLNYWTSVEIQIIASGLLICGWLYPRVSFRSLHNCNIFKWLRQLSIILLNFRPVKTWNNIVSLQNSFSILGNFQRYLNSFTLFKPVINRIL